MVKNVCGCFIMYDYLLFYGFKETDIVLQYKNNVVHFSFEGLLRKLVVTSKDWGYQSSKLLNIYFENNVLYRTVTKYLQSNGPTYLSVVAQRRCGHLPHGTGRRRWPILTSIEVANFLLLYLQPKNQKEVSVSKLLSKYPLKVLQQDILQLREQKKARFQLSTYFRPGPNPWALRVSIMITTPGKFQVVKSNTFLLKSMQLAEWILSKAPVPSSTEVFPTDVDSPDTNWCSGHMSILNKRKTHEITRQEALECQEMNTMHAKFQSHFKTKWKQYTEFSLTVSDENCYCERLVRCSTQGAG